MQVDSLTQSFCSLQRAKDAELTKGQENYARTKADVESLQQQVATLKDQLATRAADVKRMEGEATGATESLKEAERDRDALRLEIRDLSRELDRISEVRLLSL